MNLSRKQLAHESFAAYVQYMNPAWDIPDFHYDMMTALMDDEGCLVSLPPDHAKSTISTVLFSTWNIGRNPLNKIVVAVGTPVLKSVFAVQIRQIMESPRYKSLFDVKIRKDSDGKLMFHTEAGGQMLIVSKGGGIAGIRANIIIFDDIVGGAKESRSPVEREAAWNYVTQDLLTREDKSLKVKIVGVGTRWHQQDVLCRLDNHSAFKKLKKVKFKAISKEGKALWPERHNLEDLLQKKEALGSAGFESLYQQEPTSESGSTFKREWLGKFYKVLPARLERIIISMDATFSKSEDSDYVVIQAWGKIGASFYLIDQIRAQMTYTESKSALKAFSAKHKKAFKKIIEKKANGAALIDDLANEITGMVPYIPTESKVSRANSIAPLFEAGNVYLPDPSIAPWINDYIEELTSFPNGMNDDQVDGTSQALIELRENGDWISSLTN